MKWDVLRWERMAIEARRALERFWEEVPHNPEIFLMLVGESHHHIWSEILRIRETAEALYGLGARVERLVIERARKRKEESSKQSSEET